MLADRGAEHFPLAELHAASKPSTSKSFLSKKLTPLRTSTQINEPTKGPLNLRVVYEPAGDPIAALIFIHGLGGGSRKTWAKNEDPQLFWPGLWLPKDEEFQDVRILTFGYDADWAKESILNIHDFGKSLLYAIKDFPNPSRTPQCPIIFVCHSLGGLVAKKAFNLSNSLKGFEDIAQRIRVIFFLGCPHDGSNLADLLSRIIRIMPSSTTRPFLNDLQPDSAFIQTINEEFPQYCQELELHSFYETDVMNLGFKKTHVVPKTSAILGYPNERTNYLQGNHREIVKFQDEDDVNFRSLRNTIASSIRQFRGPKRPQRVNSGFSEYQRIRDALGIEDSHEDTYQRIEDNRIPGTCDWITDVDEYINWLEGPEPRIMWITAKPGAGKSFLSSRVISDLKGREKPCAFYFFGFGDKSRADMSHFLRAISAQLSVAQNEVSTLVSKQCNRDTQLSRADYRTIWRKIFSEGILKIDLDQCYIVVDALDEISAATELIYLLLKLCEFSRIRVFVTCRNAFESYGLTLSSSFRVLKMEIHHEATLSDIALYVEANQVSVPAVGQDREFARAHTLELILEKSDGCFLWVRLVIDELKRVHTAAEVARVLYEVPSDMDLLYVRILNDMNSLQYGQRLTHAILAWVACAARPLSVAELQEAVELDIDDHVDGIERAIASTCGQMVFIDSETQVRMIHQTARDFLLNERNDLDYTMSSRDGNKRLALICLKYLNGNEMADARHRKRSIPMDPLSKSAFSRYASFCLFKHINMVASEDDDVIAAIADFLRSRNVLTWIEFMVRSSEIYGLIQAGRSIKSLLQRRQKHGLILLGRDVTLVEAWSTDLIRLVTKFGRSLLASPSGIYSHIPSLCPSTSALKRQFGAASHSFEVAGSIPEYWDDCSSVMIYRDEYPAAVACGEAYLAVGLRSGFIKIHDAATCQEIQSLRQGEAVKILRFCDSNQLLACATFRTICVWNTETWTEIGRFTLEAPCKDFSLIDEGDTFLVAAMRNNTVVLWNLASGERQELGSWTDQLGEDYRNLPHPMAMALGCSSQMLAIAYRGEDIIIWDIENNEVRDLLGSDVGSRGPFAPRRTGTGFLNYLEYSPSRDSGYLAASYSDGEIVVFDTSENSPYTSEKCISARVLANAHTITSSPDGRLLACGNSRGIISLYEFETLRLLYCISSEGFGINGLAFSADGQRLIDIRGSFCRVWDPPVLISMQQEHDEQNSDTVSVSTTPREINMGNTEQSKQITAMLALKVYDKILCGRLDGAVCVFDGKNGQQDDKLIKSANNIAIYSLSMDEANLTLVCTDTYNRITLFQLSYLDGDIHANELITQRAGVPILQLLIQEGGKSCLVSSQSSDTMYKVSESKLEPFKTIKWPDRQSYRWCTHPTDISYLILLISLTAHIFSWDGLSRLTSISGIELTGSPLLSQTLQTLLPFNGLLAVTYSTPYSVRRTRSHLFIFKAQDFTITASSVSPIPSYQSLTSHIASLLGVYQRRFVFLQENGSVASVNPDSADPAENIKHHFILPPDWHSAVVATNCSETMTYVNPSNGTIALVVKDKVALIKRSLDIQETAKGRGSGLAMRDRGRGGRPSLSSFRKSDDTSRSQRISTMTSRSNSESQRQASGAREVTWSNQLSRTHSPGD